MIIIRLKGGMGNQLFQYALGLHLAKKLNTELHLDLSSLLDRSKGDFVYRNYDLSIFNIDPTFVHNPLLLQTIYKLKSSSITKAVRHQVLRGKDYIKEIDFHFQPQFITATKDNTVLEGWFQSESYFKNIEDILRTELTFKEAIIAHSQSLLQAIQSSNAICLNVRRTDFLKVDNLNTTTKTYFLNAAAKMTALVEKPHFFIFSDDIEWCKENIILDYPTTLVDHSHKGHKFGNYLQLMAACNHFIIPNSSFAWWAIWLSKESNQHVIAPKHWFNDPSIDTSNLVPEHWIRMNA